RHNPVDQAVAVRARNRPHIDVRSLLYFGDKPAPSLTDRGDKRTTRIEKPPDGQNERRRQRFHLADFVDQIQIEPLVGLKSALGDAADRGHINTVLADTWAGEIHVRDDCALTVECRKAKALAFAARADF